MQLLSTHCSYFLGPLSGLRPPPSRFRFAHHGLLDKGGVGVGCDLVVLFFIYDEFADEVGSYGARAVCAEMILDKKHLQGEINSGCEAAIATSPEAPGRRSAESACTPMTTAPTTSLSSNPPAAATAPFDRAHFLSCQERPRPGRWLRWRGLEAVGGRPCFHRGVDPMLLQRPTPGGVRLFRRRTPARLPPHTLLPPQVLPHPPLKGTLDASTHLLLL
ncbi:hypothetical protein EDB87DRAFT_1360584 [Lactarius vividus]|nr:hypothetical protein EDB87DRAFT_1360584 [Lactarius vividus]